MYVDNKRVTIGTLVSIAGSIITGSVLAETGWLPAVGMLVVFAGYTIVGSSGLIGCPKSNTE